MASRSGSRFSKAHCACPLHAGTLPASGSISPLGPSMGTVRVLCPVPPEGDAAVPIVLPGHVPALWCREEGCWFSFHKLILEQVTLDLGTASPYLMLLWHENGK